LERRITARCYKDRRTDSKENCGERLVSNLLFKKWKRAKMRSIVRVAAAYIFCAFVFFSIDFFAFSEDVGKINSFLKDETVAPGTQTELVLVFPDSEEFLSRPAIPFVTGLDIRYTGTYLHGGEKRAYTYRVIPLSEGDFELGPVFFSSGGKNYRSGILSLKSSKDAAGPSREHSDLDLLEDMERRVYAVLTPDKTRAYINEKVPITIRLYSDWLDLGDIKIFEASSADMIVDKFSDKEVSFQQKGETKFVVLSYKSYFTGVSPGTFRVDPVLITYDVMLYAGNVPGESGDIGLLNDNKAYYDRLLGGRKRRTFELKTQPVEVEVVRLPFSGRPDNFEGAIGNFEFSVETDEEKLRPGGSVRIKAVVKGPGNYDTVRPPGLPLENGLILRDIRSPESGIDKAVFVYEIYIPENFSGAIPAPEFSYFDPDARKYFVSNSKFFTVKTPKEADKDPLETKSQADGDDKKVEVGMAGIKRYSGNFTRFLPARRVIWTLRASAALPLIAAFAVLCAYFRERFLLSHPSRAALIKASRVSKKLMKKAKRCLNSGDDNMFYGTLFKAVQAYMGIRAGVSPEGVTLKGLEERFRSKNLSKQWLQLVNVFEICHEARFSPPAHAQKKKKMADSFNAAVNVIKQLNKTVDI
jgi:hypothetical protein